MGNGEFPVSIILKALDRATGPLGRMAKPFQALGQTIQGLNNSFAAHSLKMESYTKGFKGAGEALESAGLRMTLGVTAPIAAFRHEAIRAAADFESSMNRVEAATGASGDEMKGLSDLAEKVGATTTFSAHSAADAMATLARQGMSTKDIMAKLPQITNLAAASHVELGQAAEAVSEILVGYDVPAGKASKAIDVIAKASQLTRGGLESFGDAMSHVAPIAASMNIPLEETTAVIAALSRAGFTGGRAGSILAKGIAEILHPSDQAVRTLTRLRINPWDVMDAKTRNLKSIIGTLELLQSRGATTADIMTIFGTKGGMALQAILSKGTPALRELEKQLKNSGGAAEKLGEIQERGLNAQLAKLSNAFEHLGIAIGRSGILESMAGLVEKGVAALNWIGEISPAFLKWGFIILGVVAAIGPLLGYLGMIMTGIGAVLPFLSMLAAGFSTVMGVIAVMGAPIAVITTAIAALAGGAYLVYKNWQPIKDFFSGLWDTVKSVGSIFGLGGGASSLSFPSTGASNVIPFPGYGYAAPSASRARDIVSSPRSETHLLVEFENMPRGSRVKTKRADSPLDLTRGYTMENGS